MSLMGLTHFIAALIALGLGATVLALGKGTPQHRLLGRSFVVTMLAVNAAALLSYESGRFGIFHALAFLSLYSLGMALWSLRRRGPNAVADHAGWMCWTFAGLVSAATGQLGAALDLPVWVSILLPLAAAYWLIQVRRLPARLAGQLNRPPEG